MESLPDNNENFLSQKLIIKRGKKSIEFKSRVLLAPLDQITDYAFRKISVSCGAGLAFIPLIHVDTLSLKFHEFKENKINKQEFFNWFFSYLGIGHNERVGLQLIGNSPEKFTDAIKAINLINDVIKKIYHSEIILIDLNLGCPAKREVRNHEGSALLEDPSLITKILRSIKKGTEIFFSVKMRLPKSSEGFLPVIKAIRSSGASMLTVHPRTAKQTYSDKPDISFIKSAKKEMGNIMPVIGNGDIRITSDALGMVSETLCDGVMIGRSSIGNPLIFSDLRKDGPISTFNEKLKMIMKLIEIYKAENDSLDLDSSILIKIKLHLSHLAKGFSKASEYRSRIMTSKNILSLEKIISELKRINI